MDKNVTVIIPSLNPDEKLAKVVSDLTECGFTDIVLVNDGSSPEYTHFFPADHENCTLLTHEVNRGKGAALKTAFRYILDRGTETVGVLTVDGDGQHEAHDVLRLAEKMCETNAVILGVRDFSLPHVPRRSRFGNRFTSLVFRLLCGIRISDTQTGLRAIPTDVLPDILAVNGDRYEYETNMLLQLNALGVSMLEETIHTVYIEENKSSHFRPFRDSLRIYALILKFISSSLIASLVDLSCFYLLVRLFAFFAGLYTDALATLCARVISSAVNFLINKKAVFKSNASAKTSLIRYYFLSVCILALSAGSLTLITYLCGIESGELPLLTTAIKCVIDGILFICSFRIQREWVFAAPQNKKEIL